ncbi:MAG: pyridine nucleotide-disulfide oxidoreductase [Deltaproteobacteria bacterium]|nr:MAG: pyridine nucleotide-disulfide oxidoreductase [Deltaproteobacteria bacterium]
MECELAVVGAGPAGLSGAIEASKAGVKNVVVVDENNWPGGQLCKQIHKFFGGTEHGAGIRGIDIATQLVREAKAAGVDIRLATTVWGIFEDNVLGLSTKDEVFKLQAKNILIATGASENTLAFPGCTLPGVMGAGAAQTMVNLHRVSIGEKVLMVGSGNVGLIVSYQLMQAGIEVVAVVDVLPKIGGYGVHASKITRLGVPILTSHTVKEVRGDNKVEVATVAKVDQHYQLISGSERDFYVDTVCIAVGLTPLAELCWMAGCEFMYIPEMGGWIPVHGEKMETTVPGIYVAGDAAGIEEASTAVITGGIAGLAVAESLGYLTKEQFDELRKDKEVGLKPFRQGRFEFRKIAHERLTNKDGRIVKQWYKH